MATNTVIRFQTGGKTYDLFEIRNENISSLDNIKRIVRVLRKCRYYLINGDYVCGSLCEFYNNLGYTNFNDLIVYDVSNMEGDPITHDRVFCVDDIKFDRDCDELEFESSATFVLAKKS